jgi:hypothetical protein
VIVIGYARLELSRSEQAGQRDDLRNVVDEGFQFVPGSRLYRTDRITRANVGVCSIGGSRLLLDGGMRIDRRGARQLQTRNHLRGGGQRRANQQIPQLESPILRSSGLYGVRGSSQNVASLPDLQVKITRNGCYLLFIAPEAQQKHPAFLRFGPACA